jgi:DNA-binding NarL/FixJ family response regulator
MQLLAIVDAGETTEQLRAAAVAIDRARGTRVPDEDDAIALWHALIAGQWTVIDRVDSDGRRLFIARKNVPAVHRHHALTTREQQVVAHAVLGHSNKLIAYELGLAWSTVANHLTDAQSKLGVRTRAELIQLHSTIRQRRDM